jgi:hypothetical protein
MSLNLRPLLLELNRPRRYVRTAAAMPVHLNDPSHQQDILVICSAGRLVEFITQLEGPTEGSLTPETGAGMLTP